VPHAAPSGVTVNLPPVPNVPQKPIKAGDAYTVWGASYQLRSRVHHKDVADKSLKVTGYISKRNLADAPACAVHKTGKDDPEGRLRADLHEGHVGNGRRPDHGLAHLPGDRGPRAGPRRSDASGHEAKEVAVSSACAGGGDALG